METVITNDNIRDFVNKYCSGSELTLPKDLRHKPIGKWDVSRVTDMSNLFANKSSFNKPLNWDVSNVTNMDSMFVGCLTFNSPLTWNGGPWDVSKVTNMRRMFLNCIKFNQPLNWDVSNVTNMQYMFYNCEKFNSPLTWNNEPWNVLNVIFMNHMFAYCYIFNQPLNWNVSNVTNMDSMFYNCEEFNIVNNFLLTATNYNLYQLLHNKTNNELLKIAKQLFINTNQLNNNNNDEIIDIIKDALDNLKIIQLIYATNESGKHRAKEANKIKHNREMMDSVIKLVGQSGRLKSKKKLNRSQSAQAFSKNDELDTQTAAMLTALEAEEIKQYMGRGGKKQRKTRKQKYKKHY